MILQVSKCFVPSAFIVTRTMQRPNESRLFPRSHSGAVYSVRNPIEGERAVFAFILECLGSMSILFWEST